MDRCELCNLPCTDTRYHLGMFCCRFCSPSHFSEDERPRRPGRAAWYAFVLATWASGVVLGALIREVFFP